ncbi:hypothetical protein I305_04336 [Cryptococcus gattii E566]|uniref:Uncharacterized protein n=1 Tax=Cryptococcus gattii EJB2 TaxID=1296103 RepID=A0ABR5BRM5_9TREE|nr:hypothetical protein I306_04741 [Cryptococcus gattii EJB2]KIY33009.1 hypothetical protein I305_04336 [Cryptococcus gattii E566]KJD99606.1 hypothetical protein I311_06797 [Cryptococcus gattii NT-10]
MNPKFKPPESSTSPSSPSQSFHHLAPPRRFDAVQHPPADIYIAKGVFEILENDLVGDEERFLPDIRIRDKSAKERSVLDGDSA